MSHANGRPEDNTVGACCLETLFDSVMVHKSKSMGYGMTVPVLKPKVTNHGPVDDDELEAPKGAVRSLENYEVD